MKGFVRADSSLLTSKYTKTVLYVLGKRGISSCHDVRDVIGVHVCVEQKRRLEAHLGQHLRVPLGRHVHRIDDDRLSTDRVRHSDRYHQDTYVIERWVRAIDATQQQQNTEHE